MRLWQTQIVIYFLLCDVSTSTLRSTRNNYVNKDFSSQITENLHDKVNRDDHIESVVELLVPLLLQLTSVTVLTILFENCYNPPVIPTSEPTKALTLEPLGDEIIGTQLEDMMGYSVALSSNGKWLATGGNKTLHFYQEQKERWFLEQDFSSLTTEIAHSMAFSSNNSDPYLIVGDGDFDDWTKFKSFVHVIRYQNATNRWEMVGNTLSGISNVDGFGYSVDISATGEHIAVGAPLGNYVQIFSLDKHSNWFLQNTIEGSYGFGSAICLADDAQTVVIGNPLANRTVGSISIYSLINTTSSIFNPTQEVFGDAEDDWFGNSITMSKDGKFLASGTHSQLWFKRNSYVKVFHLNTTNNQYQQIGENIVGEGDFGRSVSFSSGGLRLIVGGSNEPGKLTFYRISPDGWFELIFIDGEKSGRAFGRSVDISSNGNRVAVGSPPDDGIESQVGSVIVYEVR